MRLRGKYHNSIHTLTIGAFQQVIKTGNYSLLTIAGKPNARTLQKAWDCIMDELIKEFGVPEWYEPYIELMERASRHYCNAYVHGMKHEKVLALAVEAEAKGFKPKDVEFSASLSEVSRKMGFRIAPNEVTVFEFYSYQKS